MDPAFECLMCSAPRSELFRSIETLEAHIASDHLHIFPYECPLCSYAKFPTEYALIVHNQNDHKLEEFTLNCRLTPDLIAKKAELAQLLQQALVHHREFQILIQRPAPPIGSFDSNHNTMVLGMEQHQNRVGPNVEIGEPPKPDLSFFSFSEHANQKQTIIGNMGPPEENHRVVAVKARKSKTLVQRKETRCQVCFQFVVDERCSKMYHANTRHGLLHLFKCRICSKKFTTILKKDVVRHIKSHEGQSEGQKYLDNLIDNTNIFQRELNEKYAECFPNQISENFYARRHI